MVLPILAAIGITDAIWIAVMALVRYLAVWGGRAFIAYEVIDLVSSTVETAQQVSQDNTITGIQQDTTLTPEQKDARIKQYLQIQDDKTGTDWNKLLMTGAVLVGLIIVFQSGILKGKGVNN